MKSFQQYSRLILTLVAILGLCSCQSSGGHSGGDPENGPPPLATLRRAGGLLFNDDQVYIYPDGGFTIKHLSGKRTGATASDKLPPDVTLKMKALLEATTTLNPVYPHPSGFDAYAYVLVYQGRTINWSDTSVRVPDTLVQISSLFNSAFLIAAERERAQDGN